MKMTMLKPSLLIIQKISVYFFMIMNKCLLLVEVMIIKSMIIALVEISYQYCQYDSYAVGIKGGI